MLWRHSVNPLRRAEFGTEAERFTDGIPQQIDVGGKVHVGLDHKGVTACLQAFGGVFLTFGVPHAPLPG